jgi:hypothetical protein
MQALNGVVEEAIDEHAFGHNLGSSFNCPVCFGAPILACLKGASDLRLYDTNPAWQGLVLDYVRPILLHYISLHYIS